MKLRFTTFSFRRTSCTYYNCQHWINLEAFSSDDKRRRGLAITSATAIPITAFTRRQTTRRRMKAQEQDQERCLQESTTANTSSEEVLPAKTYTSAVCMVPPESNTQLWNILTKARTEVKDPGLYRWAPHVNLLYPFVDIWSMDQTNATSILSKLREATKKIEPFYVSLNTFGCFGGKNRGVLWLYPTSYNNCASSNEEQPNRSAAEATAEGKEPMILLQQYLQDAIPYCNDQQQKRGVNGYDKFVPHMTLSHFENLDDAKQAQMQLEEWWGKTYMDSTPDVSDTGFNNATTFLLNEVYVLQRAGDEGQFKIVATIPLGQKKPGTSEEDQMNGLCDVKVWHPARSFVHMPQVEEDWIWAERMKVKARRNKGRKHRKTNNHYNDGAIKIGGVRRGPSRSTDTPEEIAAKRAARKAKRERLEALAKIQGKG